MSDPYMNRPDPPYVPPDVEHRPVQPDPALNEGRAGPVRVAVTLLGAILIVMLMLFALTSRSPEQTANSSPPATLAPQTTSQTPPQTPPAGATGQGTTEQGTTGRGGPSSRPLPQEQDPIEQNTRP